MRINKITIDIEPEYLAVRTDRYTIDVPYTLRIVVNGDQLHSMSVLVSADDMESRFDAYFDMAKQKLKEQIKNERSSEG